MIPAVLPDAMLNSSKSPISRERCFNLISNTSKVDQPSHYLLQS